MAGSLQPRVKTWVSAEDVTYSDLNAEFDNVLTAMQPLLMDDYSTNSTQMQVTTDPGESGSESLATTLAGEIARLRFAIKEIKGNVTYWYSSSTTSLSDLQAAVGGGIPSNRISSGAISASSSQSKFIVASGSGGSCTIEGTPTNLVYYIEGVAYTLSADLAVSGLVLAPSSNNTCLVNDASATGQQRTMWSGEYGTSITVDAMGSEITSLVGKLAAFKIVGAATEYFIALVESSTKLSHARRGMFFDSSGNAVKRTTFSDNDTITLLKLSYLFLKTDGTATVTYNQPTVGPVEPSSPSIGDYWFDTVNERWRTFNSVSFVTANALFIGYAIQDSTNCVGSRSIDQFVGVSDLNTVNLEYVSATQVRVTNFDADISVFGETVRYQSHRPVWDITADLHSGVSEAASTIFFFYVKENGDQVISNLAPHDLRGARKGWYHPTETWRCVGSIFNDASQDYAMGTLTTFFGPAADAFLSNAVAFDNPSDLSNLCLLASVASNALTISVNNKLAGDPSGDAPVRISFRGSTLTRGFYTQRTITSPLSITISSGSTLGHVSGAAEYGYVYAIDNGGIVELAVSSSLYDDGAVVTTTAEGGAGAADSRTAIYSTSARTNVPLRLIGRFVSNQVTAGTYAAAPTAVATVPFASPSPISNSSSLLRIEGALIAYNAGTPAVSTETGKWISSITDSGTGECAIVIPSGMFSAIYSVVATCKNNGNSTSQVVTIGTVTTTSIQILLRENGTSTDIDFHIMVIGAR